MFGYFTRRGTLFGDDNKACTRRTCIRRTALTRYYNIGRTRSERTAAVVLSRFFTGHFPTRTWNRFEYESPRLWGGRLEGVQAVFRRRISSGAGYRKVMAMVVGWEEGEEEEWWFTSVSPSPPIGDDAKGLRVNKGTEEEGIHGDGEKCHQSIRQSAKAH